MTKFSNTPLGQVRAPIHAEKSTAEFNEVKYRDGGKYTVGCTHEVIDLFDSDGHNFLAVIGYHHPEELQIIVDLVNNYAPIVYAARDILEYGTTWSGGTQSKLIEALRVAVEGKPILEDDDGEEEYTLSEMVLDL